MKWLALDTSTSHLALGLHDGTETVASLTLSSGIRHSQVLLNRIDDLLTWAGWNKQALEGIVVGLGPGGFTGLRVGVATAQGLAFALQLPLLGVSTLEAMARALPANSGLVVPCFDARKKEVYAGVFRRSGASLTPESLHPQLLMKPDSLATQLAQYNEPVLMAGSRALQYREVFQSILGKQLLIPQEGAWHTLQSAGLALLAEEKVAQEGVPTQNPWEWTPIYIRPSEAEMNIGPPEGGPPLKDRLLPDGQLRPLT
jgi:tRNA threonylcarbamoyladenosine biosynthesis protein TsaB